MIRTQHLKFATTLILAQFFSAQIFANIPYRDRGVDIDFSLTSSYSQNGIDLSRIALVHPTEDITYADVSRMVPTNISVTASGGEVASQIADRSVQAYFNSDSFKSTDIGKTSHSVEQSLKQDVTIAGSSPDSIKHNFKFNMQASQAKAMLDYSGFTNAQLSYKASGQELNFEVYHNLTSTMKLAYNHINNPTDQRDVVSLKLGF